MANLLNANTVLMCPHGGTVTAITSNTRVSAASGYVVRASDTFTIAGCSFILGSNPHPCVQVKWVQTDQHSTAVGDSTLNEDSVGLCVAGDQAAQGTVMINSTQARVSGT